MVLYAIEFPPIDPIAVGWTIGGIEFAVRWYALANIAGLLMARWLLLRALQCPRLWVNNTVPMPFEKVDTLLTWLIVAVLLCSRLGYVFLYNRDYFLAHPWQIPAVWQGGLAFHGSIIGVIGTGIILSWRWSVPWRSMGDMFGLVVCPGIFIVRIANFINGELWGRPSTAPFAVVFPDPRAMLCPEGWGTEVCARHPSQLYEAVFEGAILALLLLWLAWQRGWLKQPGRIGGLWCVGYGCARFVMEFWRAPDLQFVNPASPIGYVLIFDQQGLIGLTMGQTLCLPLIVLGVYLLLTAPPRTTTAR